ncbi:hypothetical protein RE6C_01538 [Rhodopirellula europaea 6C]|uniref:Uncharacterized protein n=1 Tax=Rhodopirellula europaea 6C TaxID=1263867 RepID=M2A7Y2_9BACT|nr:hypothetical protein RE6C_01538 [Rhodopirellula europaea 6C]
MSLCGHDHRWQEGGAKEEAESHGFATLNWKGREDWQQFGNVCCQRRSARTDVDLTARNDRELLQACCESAFD